MTTGEDGKTINLRGIASPSRHPPFNIALEEALRQRMEREREAGYLLCWRNQEAVIVGRNQDALAELSPAALRCGVRVFRRTSGGGAVYHDAGNLNWSLIVPGELAERDRLLDLVLGVLHALGIAAEAGPRAGIYANGEKIGGTAAAVGHGILLFHGTLMVSTNLSMAQSVLAAHEPTYARRRRAGVGSVPSAMTTLERLQPGLTVERVTRALFGALARDGKALVPDGFIERETIQLMAQDYGRESWILERQPPATNWRKAS